MADSDGVEGPAAEVRERFEADGFAVLRGLFGQDETERLCAEFAALHAAGPVPGHFEPRPDSADPLQRYPRVMHPHEISAPAREFLLDAPGTSHQWQSRSNRTGRGET